MKAKFELQSLQDNVTAIGSFTFPQPVKASDLAGLFPQWFKIGTNELTDAPELHAVKYSGVPFALSVTGSTTTYQAMAIRLFGKRRPRKPKSTHA